jgi:hypothetical protein
MNNARRKERRCHAAGGEAMINIAGNHFRVGRQRELLEPLGDVRVLEQAPRDIRSWSDASRYGFPKDARAETGSGRSLPIERASANDEMWPS